MRLKNIGTDTERHIVDCFLFNPAVVTQPNIKILTIKTRLLSTEELTKTTGPDPDPISHGFETLDKSSDSFNE
jgi:hypothetical protein